MYQEMFNKKMEELSQNLNIDANGQDVPFEVVSESQTPTV
jgi:hypothetical protein